MNRSEWMRQSLSALALLACLSACMHQPPSATPPPATPPQAMPPAAPSPAAAPAAEAPAPPSAPPAPAAQAATPAPAAPPSQASRPAVSAPSATPPAPPAKNKPVPPPATAAPGKAPAGAGSTAGSSAATASKPAPAATVAAAPSLDLTSLEQRLRETRAIGVFTKLSLKNQVDDLLTQFRAYHQGQPKPTLAELRAHYELLLLKVVSLLQDGDAPLASAVSSSREAIWVVLTDPKKFAQI
jgi:hypothetical protein